MATLEIPGYMEKYLSALVSGGKTESTIKKYRSDLRVLLKWSNHKFKDQDYLSLDQLQTLSKDDYIQFIQWMGSNKYSEKSQIRISTVITKLLQFLNVSPIVPLRDLIESPKTFPLNKKDFITDKEYKALIDSFTSTYNIPDSGLLAHKELSNRNVSVILLMRFYGLTAKQISAINMEDVNFGQDELTIHREDQSKYTYKLDQEHKKLIKKYLDDIDENTRPHYYSKHPLFVAYNNTYGSFQYDNYEEQPKRLAVRSIVKLLKVERGRADLRPLSAIQLRNRCILDYLKDGHNDKETMEYFGITYPYYLKRFKKYLSSNLPS